MIILSSRKAYKLLSGLIKTDVEEFWVIGLSSNKTVLATECLFRGTVDSCLVHPRDVFRFACTQNASSLIVAHSHPSGDTRASKSDLKLTEKLVQAGTILQIPIIDHLIISKETYRSFLDEGWLSLNIGRR